MPRVVPVVHRIWTSTCALLLFAPLLAGCIQVSISTDGGDDASIERIEGPEPTLEVSLAWQPEFPRAGDQVTFQIGSATSTEEGDELESVSWTIAGTPYDGALVRHRFTGAGFYDVTLEATSRLAGAATATGEVTVFASDGQAPAPGAAPGDDVPQAARDAVAAAGAPTITVTMEENMASFGYDWPLEPDSVAWAFGDGSASTEAAPEHTYMDTGDFAVSLTVAYQGLERVGRTTVNITSVPYIPHVIVAVPDTGINPYHEMYHRPGLTAHPCTYIKDFPCDIPALNLTLDAPSWDAAYQADKAEWDAIGPGDVFWIPETVFVAVLCDSYYQTNTDTRAPSETTCILDDTHMHGTGTTSSVLMENPDALIAFKEGRSGIGMFQEKGIPVDIYSVSWGYVAPIPVLGSGGDVPLYVKSAGNDPRSSLIDGWSGQPHIISVGGAYAQGQSEETMATKQPEIVSYYCRPTAQTESLDGMRPSYCGTSFAGPTAAGALSKVLLAIRQESGYTGTVEGHHLDPVWGLTVGDLRTAMNLTASYDPEAQYDNDSITGVPLNSAAPWTQWGWGFYDGLVADRTIAHLLGEKTYEKPDEAVLWMETMFTAKELTHPI